MGKKEQKDQKKINNNLSTRVEAVLELLKKQAPLSLKQEKFCNNACVERFLKAKGEHVNKAAKQLRACLSWRDSLGTENLIADEFSAELAEGVAYVSGHDDESRPVLIFRIKQDYQKFHSHKLWPLGPCQRTWNTLFSFSMEAFFRSASAFMSFLLAALKVVAEYYPGRLYKAFVIDPPSLFSYLWKGVKPFVELSTTTSVVSSLDFEESLDFNDFSSYPRACSSLRYDASSIKTTSKVGSCASSRFSFTVSSHHFDSLKPWYLSLTDTSASKLGPTSSGHITPALGPALISPLNARSLSFVSPAARTPVGGISKRSLFPSTPLPERRSSRAGNPTTTPHARTPRPSFLQSPALFFRRECHISRTERCRESFVPFLKFYRRPYDEMIYRSKMRPPLGGLISIVSPHLRRRHVSVSQRF